MTDKPNLRRLRTPEFRMSFPALLEARENDEGKKRFELTMLFRPASNASRSLPP